MKTYRNTLYDHAVKSGYIQKEDIINVYGIPALKQSVNPYDIFTYQRQINALPLKTIKVKGELENLLNWGL